ncbi:MAG: cytochrome c-type biogenesis protein [Pseudomonadota bacterium]
MITRIIILLALLLGPAGPAMAQVDYTNSELADPAQEREAKALMDTIRCVVCQGQPISGSNADLAGDMRALIRERIAAGEEPEAIRAWRVSRYGAWVSFKPELHPSSAPLWLTPFAALIAGLFLIRGRFKKRA